MTKKSQPLTVMKTDFQLNLQNKVKVCVKSSKADAANIAAFLISQIKVIYKTNYRFITL